MSETSTTRDKLIELITPLVEPLGYEIIHLETQLHHQKILRIFVDRLPTDSKEPVSAISIEDCVNVSRALDEPLDLIPEIEKLFQGPYELEVSSPGIDRPLRKPSDYDRFAGREVRIHVFRPLTAEELSNTGYHTKNPKQKHFLGTLMGIQNEKVRLSPSAEKTGSPKKKGKAKAAPDTNSVEEITIPLPLISKANLEPDFSESLNEKAQKESK